MSNVMGDFGAGKEQESENLDQITAARHERAAACVAACLMFVACPHLPFRKADANIAWEVFYSIGTICIGYKSFLLP